MQVNERKKRLGTVKTGGSCLINADRKSAPSTLTRLGSCPCESLFSDATAGGEMAFTSG